VSPRSSLPPFATGWYALCASGELPPGRVLARTLCGRELALYRTSGGQAVAVNAACPHLGAHLGHTSTVEGETLRCSFHGFRFDPSGACVATGYGTRPPPKCSLATWPLHEVNGFVLVYFDPAGRPPSWHVPAAPRPREDGWTRTRTRLTRLPAHVQDLAENSVDVGHLSHVHGYRELEPLGELRTEGPVLRARYAFRHPRGLFGIGKNARAEIDIRAYGLGYSQVEVTMAEVGFRSRQFVLASPVDGEHVDLRIGMCMKPLPRALRARGSIPALVGALPARLFDSFVAAIAFQTYCDDVDADVPIWSTRLYLDSPRLAEGDGPIGQYRRWARQFYPEVARSVGERAPAA
jgi:nitrite reductase/ring-hydroxylating ferredoxin subunit